MATLQEFINANRFAYGMRPDETSFTAGMLAQFGVDPADTALEIPDTDARRHLLLGMRQARREDGRDSAKYQRLRDSARALINEDFRHLLLRPMLSPRGFKERIFAFWLDHFSVSPKRVEDAILLGGYFKDAIRPNLNGTFADLLKAVVTHPSMLMFLDQNVSVGPNSRLGQRRDRGLNENLAREVLELHTLGVNAGYSQEDVQQFAELLTGLTVTEKGTEFIDNIAEPGPETILGQTYGAGRASLENIFEFLEDLAVHPATAQHLAQKFAVHFIGPEPDADYVNAMAQAYLASGGQLSALYRVLLEHPVAQTPLGQKSRTPFEYMVCCLRAVGTPAETILDLEPRALRQAFFIPLTGMGQSPFAPPGPDGWDEALGAWITPPTLAARINWAGELAQNSATHLDPRRLLEQVLGPLAPDDLSFAVAAAETKWEGVALMLISPTFIRR